MCGMRVTTSIMFGAALVAVGACSSDGRAATATKGDAFCTAAAAADAAGNAVDFGNGTPESLEASITAAIAASKTALSLAPSDARDVVGKAVELQERLNKVLADNDYNQNTFLESEAGQALINDPVFAQAGKDLKSYLETKCGIAAD